MRGDHLQPLPPRRFGPSRQDQQQALGQLNAFGAMGGAGGLVIRGGGGPTFLPDQIREVWAVITENALSSGEGVADQGSGQGQQGALHGWRMIRFLPGLNGTWSTYQADLGGTMLYLPLVELNSRIIPVGEVVRAYNEPGGQCWSCVWGGVEGSGSGGNWEITCTATGATARRV